MKDLFALFLAVLILSPIACADNDWTERSNENAQLLLDVLAKFGPEGAAALGVDGLDEEIFDLRPKLHERTQKASRDVMRKLVKRLSNEEDSRVAQDLEILVKAIEDNLRTTQLQHDKLLPYFNMTQNIFRGLRALIDPQIPTDRYPAAIVRLRKYAGIERGYQPITELAMDRTKERFGVDGLIGPYKGEVEQDLARADTFIDGMQELLANSRLDGWEEPYETVAGQLRAYNQWLASELLPRAREDFRQPPALYEDALRNWGVYEKPENLIRMATQGYMNIRNEMEALAPLVAARKDYESTDYRDVIARLKEERIPGNELLEYYYARLKDIEDFIRENDLVTLPERDAGIRIATAAETAAQPAAHLDIPRLIGNTGEYPEFVLPKLQTDEDGNWIGSDDTYEAGTWTLTAHEARPGHEMQFSSMLETGVSVARAIFAFNSANVEGWGLYAEAIAKPYMPLEGQLISLQYRLARAARMFLDPMLNLGRITPEEAKRLLVEDVVLGESWAQNEIERYTYRIPGQATAYYYGYMNMQSLRTRTELALKDRFDQRAFHDFILAQGLLPPDLLEKAVMEHFVPQQLERVAAGP
ncbi:MAG: DUF885 domain-containing protein [Gammaproteobacteria bacterium]|nr:DUF885 domain-containing protein [Gammaproteobacteria bacterium]